MDTNLNCKKRYNKKGFTLIELLAVIVVLAIVTVIAVNAILPQMDDARKNAFAIEANGLIKSAQQYIVTVQLTKGIVLAEYDEEKAKNTTYCISVDNLITEGQSELRKGKYKGYVKIKKVGNILLYEATLDNEAYMVVGAGLNEAKDANASISQSDVSKSNGIEKTFSTNDCIDLYAMESVN